VVGRWFAVFACMAGCDWTLGLHRFDHPPDAPDPKDDLGLVQGTYHQHWIENASTGAPIAMDRIAMPTASVTLSDGSTRPVTFDAGGTFTFTTETIGQRYTLDMRTPFIDTVYELDATAPVLVERFSGRIDRALVPSGTALRLSVINRPAVVGKEELHTTGLWDQRLQIDATAGLFMVDWTTLDGIGGPMGLLDAGKHDALYYTHYSTLSYNVLDAFARADTVTLAGGSTTIVSVNSNAVAANLCTKLAAQTTAEVARLVALHPTPNVLGVWGVMAAPSVEFAPTTTFPLAYFFAATDSDLALSPNYPAPYTGHSVVAELVVVTSFNNAATTTTTLVPAGNCPSTTTIPVGVVAVPIELALGPTSLFEGDGSVFAIDRTRPIPVTWTVSDTGTADFYVVKLQEILDPSPNLRTRDTVTFVTMQPGVTIDPTYFVSGPTYRIEVVAMLGYPNAHAGDFTTVATTTSMATVDSVQFKVQ
jgi:hypothetical protein